MSSQYFDAFAKFAPVQMEPLNPSILFVEIFAAAIAI